MELRRRILAAWGGFPAEPCPLEPQVRGALKRDGYRVEQVVLQTRPGIRMTANAYVPEAAGKVPAVLVVHGHWRGAKQDPVVQARCLGLVKLGFFVLAVDAFGAGERGLGKALGEYRRNGRRHAAAGGAAPVRPASLREPTGGRLPAHAARGGWPADRRHRRQRRRQPDDVRGGWDDRFAAVVPVCSVGNYQAYLGAACCMCEVVPGALQFTEEGSVLGLTAPRGLMVVNATRDAVQFSVAEARKSLAQAQPVFDLCGRPDHLKHAIFESPTTTIGPCGKRCTAG